VYYPGVSQLSQAQPVAVKAGEEAEADITMHRLKTFEISGRVICAAGRAANVSVSAEPADDSVSEFDSHGLTDQTGSFRLRAIPPGTYYILAVRRDQGTGSFECRARQKIEVSGNIDSLTLAQGASTTIQGRLKVDRSPVRFERIHVALVPTDRSLTGSRCQPKKDGRFEIESVPEGNYRIAIDGLPSNLYVESVRLGPDDLLEKGLQVEGSFSGPIEVVLGSAGAQLEGSVTDDDGAGIGAQLRLVPDPLTPYNHFRIHRTTTDQMGHFSLPDVAPGKYQLFAKPLIASDSASLKSESQPVTLSENDHQTIQMKLAKRRESEGERQ
jgi:hypothetical protein